MRSNPFEKPGRYYVPDLSPLEREKLKGVAPRAIFVAESPHLSEITPDAKSERRPLCGKAGQAWWRLLSELLEGLGKPDAQALVDVSLKHLLKLCSEHHLVVLNAVQYPLDPKITATFPEADPARTVGFSKAPGPAHYKKMKNTPELKQALENLRARLNSQTMIDCPVYCLGLDAEWFVAQALGAEEFERRVKGRIPHPSAWWRKGGHFGRVAREKLEPILHSSLLQ